MGIFDAFYFMSYTATTIGFGELPHAVHRGAADVGHAHDLPGGHRVGLRDRFAAVADAGPGRSAQALARRTLHQGGARACGSRSCCSSATATPPSCWPGRWTTWASSSSSSTTRSRGAIARSSSTPTAPTRPALLGDARDTGHDPGGSRPPGIVRGCVALAGDDETNLDVAMTTALLRPDLPVIARSGSRDVADRMRAFGTSRRWSTRSTGSVTTCGSCCGRRRPTS